MHYGGVHSEMVIGVGNEIVNQYSNPGRGCLEKK